MLLVIYSVALGKAELIELLRTIDLPLPTARLASVALRALQVDAELSPLVSRSFSLHNPEDTLPDTIDDGSESRHDLSRTFGAAGSTMKGDGGMTVLRTEYKATTNRMLRVAVNGFMESLGVVLGVMAELDVDVFDPGVRNEVVL